MFDLTEARERGYLVCRASQREIERQWRATCDSKGVPSIVVHLRRGIAGLYIDPPRAMRQDVMTLLWPMFRHAAAKRCRANKPIPFGCSRHYCQINLARADAVTMAARVA